MNDNRWTVRATEWQVRKQKTEEVGECLWRTTFSSGGTQSRYKVQGTVLLVRKLRSEQFHDRSLGLLEAMYNKPSAPLI